MSYPSDRPDLWRAEYIGSLLEVPRRSHPIKWFNESINRKVLAILTEAYKPAPEWWRCCFQNLPDVSSSPGRWMKLELRCHRNWLYSKIWKQMQAPEWQGDIIVIITRSSLFADSVFLGCSNARCLDLMCGASSQLRSRNSNTSLDKEGNAIRAKSTGLDLFRWTHIFPTKIAIWKVYPIFRQTHTHTYAYHE